MRRHALRDDQWDRIKDFCPAEKDMWAARRPTIGCLWRPFFSGTELAFLGATFRSVSVIGKSSTSGSAGGRRVEFSNACFKLLASDPDNEYMMIDATIVRAHQHSAGARKKTARKRSADRAAD